MEDTWVREVEDGPTTTRVRIVPFFILRSWLDKVIYNGNGIMVLSIKILCIGKSKKYSEHEKNGNEKNGIM